MFILKIEIHRLREVLRLFQMKPVRCDRVPCPYRRGEGVLGALRVEPLRVLVEFAPPEPPAPVPGAPAPTCALCRKKLVFGGRALVFPCGHAFHEACFEHPHHFIPERWFNEGNLLFFSNDHNAFLQCVIYLKFRIKLRIKKGPEASIF